MARTTSHSHDAHGGNCVAYAREVTGVHLDGNAAAWWPHAEGRYERGHRPQVGAILVFRPYGRMHVGHVAVVSRIVSSREVLVDQANWVRGRVTKAISVVDASPGNDWTSVKVQYAGTHGRENPTYGFIYPHVLPADFEEAVAAAEPAPPRVHHADRAAGHHEAAAEQDTAQDDPAPQHVAARAKHHKDTDEQDAAAQDDPAPRHVAAHAKHHKDADDQEAAAQADPAPRHVAARAKHHKDTDEQEAATQDGPQQHVAAHTAHHKTHPVPDEAKDDQAAQQQLAAAAPPHHKHKDARVAYVLY